MDVLSFYELSALVTTIFILIFYYHINFKKISLLSILNEALMFRKMVFNKKFASRAGKIIIISHFLICSYVCLYALFRISYDVLYQYGWDLGMHVGLHSFSDIAGGTLGNNISSIISSARDTVSLSLPSSDDMLGALFCILGIVIIRLIYEFIVIPVAINNMQKQTIQSNNAYQQANQQLINAPYVQQNYATTQNQETTYVQSQQPIQTVQQPEQESFVPETQFKFCSQCGTQYDATEDKCPNCGMK